MNEQTGEKTEQPTAKRLEEAWKKGQFPRSAELQTIAVLAGGMLALMALGPGMWRQLAFSMSGILGHLHDIPITTVSLQGQFITGLMVVGQTVAPVVAAIMVVAVLVGAAQTRFRLTPEVLGFRWERLNPMEGLKRLFSFKQAGPTGIALLKLTAITALTYGAVLTVMNDPIFSTPVSTARIAGFIADTSFQIVMRVAGALAVIAAIDYAYQFWNTQQELMMTRQELKQESKDAEGNRMVKSRQGKRRRQFSQRKMLLAVPLADVIVTNPTHIAIALKYDRKTMRAPKILAKGTRLNAARIKEIAARHQVPMLENKPLARMLLKHGRVGAEIPAQFYTAVAEILAWVYRINRYRYYAENNNQQS